MNKKLLYLIAPILLFLLFGYNAMVGGDSSMVYLGLSLFFLLHSLLLVYIFFIRRKR